jgi:hypothetical protein
MKRIYVAGAYSAPTVLQVLGNMRRGMQLAGEVLKAGFAPFTPWFDYHYCLQDEIALETLYRYSLAWLEASDAVIVVLENADTSVGTQNEIMRAEELGIPVFWSLEDLKAWASQ